MSTQVKFATNDFAQNPTTRCPCVLLLDVSDSMKGRRIAQLNEGLQLLKTELRNDDVANRSVEVAIITFDTNVNVIQPFTIAYEFEPPTLEANGNTMMGQAILDGIDLVEQRKATYRMEGVPYFRPWLFLITDGAPTDKEVIPAARSSVHAGEAANKFLFYAVGVDGANMTTLRSISVQEPTSLASVDFPSMFKWLSNSLGIASRATPGAPQTFAPFRKWSNS